MRQAPWWAEGEDGEGYLVIRDVDGRPLAFVSPDLPREEQEAVAWAMASAPDLMQAVKTVWSAQERGTLEKWTPEAWRTWARKTAPGIAKALGML